MHNSIFMAALLLLICTSCSVPAAMTAQAADRWQQRVEYNMDIDFDATTHRFTGKQSIKYFNNSPDALTHVFYHLYFNAFQPGSMMDVRSRTIKDPDRRVGDRISLLKPDEIGYQKIKSLKRDGKPVPFQVVGTILEVKLGEPIRPNSSTVFEMEFEAQVPLQIRRSGRNSEEGIDYSMAQWYPKMCEYDYQGWHANPYIAREFHGVWGDFDVKISIDKRYVIGATGYLQNPKEIGHGYQPKGTQVSTKADKLTWHFKAPNVHDFVWGADPDYTHDTFVRPDGLTLRFFYLKGEKTEAWADLPRIMDKAFDYINANYGPYPYQEYVFIQGGDGGMEYPMATLITGERGIASLVGVSVHELMHSWFQMMMATNESLYGWMDEGFTSYASTEVMNFLRTQKLIPGTPSANPHAGTVNSFASFALSGEEEALSTHADHFETNTAYSVGAYVKGAVFLHQLSYIIGEANFRKGMLAYYEQWRFRHPNPNDFIRVMEKTAGMELDWYKEYWVYSTHTIDYAVNGILEDGSKTRVLLDKIGRMPMPLDVRVTYTDGKAEWFNIPLVIMRGEKAQEDRSLPYTVLPDWPWVNPQYEFTIPRPASEVLRIEIDPLVRMADTDRSNNVVDKK